MSSPHIGNQRPPGGGGRLGFLGSVTLRFLFGSRGFSEGKSRRGSSFRRVRGGVIGITLSLIPLVVVFVVANGMISGITARYLETGSYHIQLVSRGRAGAETSRIQEEKALEYTQVIGAYREVQGLGLLAGGKGHNGVQIRGIDPQLYEKDRGFRRYMEVNAGEFNLEEPRSIVLGQNVANTLGLEPGDRVRVITARSDGSRGLLPKVSAFTVTGIVSSGYRELDALWVFMSSEDAMSVIPPGEAREIIGIKVMDPFSLDPQAGNLSFIDLPDSSTADRPGETPFIYRFRQGLDTDWRLYTWFDLERSQYMSFITTRNLLLFIMVLIVLVAAVNISSAMIMLVLEKQEEIAVLKAMGMPNSQLMAVFVAAGGITGTIGTVLGLSLGSLAAYNVNGIVRILEYIVNAAGFLKTRLISPRDIYIPFELFNPDFYLSSIPVNLHPADVLIMAGVSIMLSVVMSLLPARRAVRLDPISLLHRH